MLYYPVRALVIKEFKANYIQDPESISCNDKARTPTICNYVPPPVSNNLILVTFQNVIRIGLEIFLFTFTDNIKANIAIPLARGCSNRSLQQMKEARVLHESHQHQGEHPCSEAI